MEPLSLLIGSNSVFPLYNNNYKALPPSELCEHCDLLEERRGVGDGGFDCDWMVVVGGGEYPLKSTPSIVCICPA